MVVREVYMRKLESFIDKPFVKILTGIRRSGKSSVLLLLREKLILKGVSPEQIIHVNFESFTNADFLTAEKLYHHMTSLIQKGRRSYILFDEIQEVNSWEKCVNSMMVDFDVDIFLTGSNSHLLSSELATYLAGRYVEVPVYTLSFNEYLQFHSVYQNTPINLKDAFLIFLRFGGFPGIHTGAYTEETAYKIVYDIYSSVILRDTVQRYHIRDIELLERVIRYAMDNIGNTFSGKNVADYFKSQQRKVDLNTIYNYLHALEGAFILYRVPRYDIKGKEILKTQEKFYLSDVALLYATLGHKDRLIAGVLENVVFLELKRRGYSVYVGKIDAGEVDFIAEKSGKKLYIQVTYQLNNPSTIDREFGTLLNIKDQFPKYVVSMDEFWKDSMEGVEHWYITDFLLSDLF
jgi:hypothetical protein